jgi:hypothetical protein
MLFAEATNVTIRALISGAVALIGPILALTRWIQEKSTKHRSRDEMQRSHELFEFIRRYPKMSAATGSSGSAVLVRAREELAQSMTNVDNLLEKRALKAAPPTEIAWPRRLFLLYAPRSWGATALHTIYYLFITFSMSAIFSLGDNDETEAFQWREYLTYFHNPVFWMGLSFWAIQLWLLWYATTTKDRWDGTLPIDTAKVFFLRQVPVSARELIARMFLVWSLFDLAVPKIFRGSITRAPNASPIIASILNALPKVPRWEHIVAWTITAFCPVLAYLWARAEFTARGMKLWIPFPHNLRFLYPTSRRRELLAEGFFVYFALYFILSILRTHQLFSITVPVVPSEDQGAFLMGFMWSALVDLMFAGIIPLYAAYRLGLISYLVDQQHVIAANESEAKTKNVGDNNPETNNTRSEEDVIPTALPQSSDPQNEYQQLTPHHSSGNGSAEKNTQPA